MVIELEVSNRNPKAMRRDYATYFDEDCMICVIGIKLFGESKLQITFPFNDVFILVCDSILIHRECAWPKSGSSDVGARQ